MKNIHNTISNPLDTMLHRIAFNMALHDFLRDHSEALGKDHEEENEKKESVHPSKQEQKEEEGLSFLGFLRKLHEDDEPDNDDTDSEDLDEDDEEDDDEENESATNAFLKKHYKPNILGLYMPRPRVKCADGYTVSIQAGSGSNVRCWPHEDTNHFSHVQLDTPSCQDKELIPYRMEPDDENEIFFFFVPVEVVDRVLKKHGGIVGISEEDGLAELLAHAFS